MRTPTYTALALAVVLLQAPAVTQAEYTVERVVSGLTQPMLVTQAPGDNNLLYIVERTDGGSSLGRILAYDQVTKSSSTFLDLSGTTVSDGGLLSMAFHPEYQSNGLFYTVSNASRTNGLDEWRVVNGVPQLERRLFEYENLQNVFHTLNQVIFRPNGDSNELFVTSGDGGTQANSPEFDAALIEDPDSPFGKLLRFDLNGDYNTPAGGASHPDVDVIALGLRNPYRSSFDSSTGDFYTGDVGYVAVEEVNFIPASHFENPAAPVLDFGWTEREGTIQAVSNAGGPGSAGDLDPIFEYAHNGGVALPHPTALTGGSITGGHVYRGPVSELDGKYFFADFTSQVIYSGEFDGATPTGDYDGDNFTNLLRHDIEFENLLNDGTTLQFLTSFGEDNNGNLYIVKFGNSFFPPAGQGEVFRISLVQDNPIEVDINRTTGSITLLNQGDEAAAIESVTFTSLSGAIDPFEITTPITGIRDVNGDMTIDNNDAWAISSATNSLYAEATTGDAGTLAPFSEVVYSAAGGWIPSPLEDIVATITLADGTIVDALVTFGGNNGSPFAAGDLDFDGDLDRQDFVTLMSGLHTDISALSPAQQYGGGDLTGDGLTNYEDFVEFKELYVALNGESAFARLATAPEPHGLLLLGCALAAAASARRRS